MAVSLAKGGNVSLTKSAPSMTKVTVGLGWDARSTDGAPFDLDASAFLCGADRKALSDAHFVFYGNLTTADQSVAHQGDNLTGAGDGDDEVVIVDLAKVPADVHMIPFVVTIHEAEKRSQSFGQVSNAYIRVADADSGEVIARYDLGEDASTETAMVFGEMYRHNGDWKFRAIGQGFNGGLAAAARDFGIDAS